MGELICDCRPFYDWMEKCKYDYDFLYYKEWGKSRQAKEGYTDAFNQIEEYLIEVARRKGKDNVLLWVISGEVKKRRAEYEPAMFNREVGYVCAYNRMASYLHGMKKHKIEIGEYR